VTEGHAGVKVPSTLHDFKNLTNLATQTSNVSSNLCLPVHETQNQIQGTMTASRPATTEGKTASDDANRQRRAHKKSRRGCSGCKLRRVKCDERRPACHRCRDFGVACTYDGIGKTSALSFAGESSFDLNELSATPRENAFIPTTRTNTKDHPLDTANSRQLSRSQRLGELSTILAQFTGLPSPPDSDEENSSYAFGRSELEIFQRFNERTVLSVGSSQVCSR